MPKFVFAGGTAVVTGAASGIGEALAYALARRNSNLVLVDRDAERLDNVAATVRRQHHALEVSTHVVDLSDAKAATQVATAIRHEHPQVRLLVNNAGVALSGRFDQVSLDEFTWVMDTNFRAVAILTHTLLPALKAEPGSHLVNMSSVLGLVAVPRQAAYAASKFAIRGLTEALRHELAEDGIGVTLVHPGGVRTRIAASARQGSGISSAEAKASRQESARTLTIEPTRAAEIIVHGIRRRRGRVLIGWSARFPDLMARLLPTSHGAIVAAATRPRGKAAAVKTT
jgi:short-subunit dehydrogenase